MKALSYALLFAWVETCFGFLFNGPSNERRITSFTPRSSWTDIEASFSDLAPEPISIDSVLDPGTVKFSTERPTLFRERHGWCPYSERVWLALELANTPYDTVRIDNTGGGRPSYFAGQTPQVRWEDGRTQGESMDLVERIDASYPSSNLQASNKDVQETVKQFSRIFPRARPSSRAAFLFQYNGEPLWKSTLEETLRQTDELLSESEGGFFCGPTITAADVAWAPFLERYRYQLPCLHKGLIPDDDRVYPHLAAWYRVMDNVPAYACRVKGDASSWRKVLTMAGFGNSGVPPNIVDAMEERIAWEEEQASQSRGAEELWTEYATMNPHVGKTASAEAARIIAKNRLALVSDCLKHTTTLDSDHEVDEALRQLASTLQSGNTDNIANRSKVGHIAATIDKRMCVPRDMGALSATCIKKIALDRQG